MATTIFIALQCCQCATMQVKQQKKSSSKWTCVVCNQKQSVRKVFAQGFMAKDVRKFVQSFNMSRLSSDLEALDPPLEGGGGGGGGAVHDRAGSGDWKKLKRSDWGEYLDVEQEMRAEEEEDDGGMKIVTEIPKEILKKPKLNVSSCQSPGSKGGKLFTPSFTKRNVRKQTTFPDEEPKKNQNVLAFRTSGRTNSKGVKDIDPVISQSTAVTRSTTKWSNYMSQDEDTLQVGMYKDDVDRFSNGVLESKTNDQKVEDDIHPDFM
ncbi:MRN complex-interacting protein isoform X2 [Rhodamnia argentea]|uniref:MRN complex-interacting protein isoform X2 n=1 Tax=Rhodamnia argentea TaxID=178133 RepID=A0A8B8MUP7_9MYRT|nr:MRN complex-interacting protein isoform X2 [Rhodamnia argentea]